MMLALTTFTLVWTVTISLILYEEKKTWERNVAELSSICASVSMHAERVFADAAQLATFLRIEFQRAPKTLTLSSWNEKHFVNPYYYSQVGVINSKGMLIASNVADFRPIDLSDRPHFTHHIDANSDTPYVSETLIGRASGRPSIQVTRRINSREGAFQGVSVVSVSPGYFVDKYDGLLASTGFIGLLGTDGKSRIVKTRNGFTVGDALSGMPWFRDKVGSMDSGAIEINGWPSSSTQLMAFKKVDGWPLIAIVGIDTSEAMESYKLLRTSYLAAATIISLALAITLASQIRFNRRLRLSNRNLRQTAGELQAANHIKDRFIAHVSHELRTPIAGIMSGAELLKISSTDPEQAADAESISKASRHLLDVVNNLLSLSRGQAEGFIVRLESVALSNILLEVCQPWRAICEANGIRMQTDFSISNETRVVADATALRQILQNLVSNAVKFTESGTVAVSVHRTASFVRIAVEDSGPGIAPEQLPGLFKQFGTLEQWETRNHHGAGLGLFLSQQLAGAMDTVIQVSTKYGKGSTFFFDLPTARDEVDGGSQ